MTTRIFTKLFSLLFAISITPLLGQNQTIGEGLTGSTLVTYLQTNYTPDQTLGYNTARDKMYSQIDNDNGTVTGVYTGFTVYVDPNSPTPRADAYQDGQGINAEHTWPKSMGAENEPAESDLHHIYPTWVLVNSDRGNLPFGIIASQDADDWYIFDQITHSVPASDIDDYSRRDRNVSFEPRLEHRGNVARAMFYFYTIYRDRANTNFFEIQKNDLYVWNQEDPVDSAEVARSHAIAAYQGNDNPFILDTTLVRRAYFSSATPLPSGDIQPVTDFRLKQNYPNPFNPETTISFDVPSPQKVRIVIYNETGEQVGEVVNHSFSAGVHQVKFNGKSLPSGIYFYRLMTGTFSQTRKMVLMK